MEHDIYLLIANHLRDIYHLLEGKIIENKAHRPQWHMQKVDEKTEMVVELSSLYGVVNLLEKLAGPTGQQSFSMFQPGQDEE